MRRCKNASVHPDSRKRTQQRERKLP
jgi:hypothetical protein